MTATPRGGPRCLAGVLWLWLAVFRRLVAAVPKLVFLWDLCHTHLHLGCEGCRVSIHQGHRQRVPITLLPPGALDRKLGRSSFRTMGESFYFKGRKGLLLHRRRGRDRGCLLSGHQHVFTLFHRPPTAVLQGQASAVLFYGQGH